MELTALVLESAPSHHTENDIKPPSLSSSSCPSLPLNRFAVWPTFEGIISRDETGTFHHQILKNGCIAPSFPSSLLLCKAGGLSGRPSLTLPRPDWCPHFHHHNCICNFGLLSRSPKYQDLLYHPDYWPGVSHLVNGKSITV